MEVGERGLWASPIGSRPSRSAGGLGTPFDWHLKWGQSSGTEPLTCGVCTNSR